MKFPVPFLCKLRIARIDGLARIIGLLMVVGLLQACSAIKIAYNQASELAYWQLDGYFDFTDEQTPQVREELARIHQWHRQTQLPVYVQTLEQWQAWMPGDLNEDRVCQMTELVRERLLAISERSQTAAVVVVPTLAPAQLDHLKRKFSKLNSEYRNDFIDGRPQALFEKRFRKAVSRAEMLYGTLEEKQLAVLRARMTQSVFNPGVSLAEHQRRQRDALHTLAQVMAGPSSPEQIGKAVRAYSDRAVNSPDAAYRAYQERLTRDSCKTFAELHNSTNAVQRAKAAQTLAGYAQDFRILSGQRS
jgi:hypothetical protein